MSSEGVPITQTDLSLQYGTSPPPLIYGSLSGCHSDWRERILESIPEGRMLVYGYIEESCGVLYTAGSRTR